MKASINQSNPPAQQPAPARPGNEIDTPQPPQFGFLDREELLTKLNAALAEGGPILLEGPLGVGKTELAMFLARRQAGKDGPFKALIYFDLQNGLGVDRVRDRLLHHFSAQLERDAGGSWAEWPEARQVEALQRYLCSHPSLLILDHLEAGTGITAEEERRLLAFLEGLSSGATRVILISEKLPATWFPQAARHEVSGLPLPAAQCLALEIFQTAGFTARKISSLGDYQDLLLQLECNPLAMRIVLPDLIRQEPGASVRELRELQEKTSPGEVVWLALRYRIVNLDPGLRKRLAVLGLFRGCISARIITAMASLEDAPSVISALDREEWLRLLETFAEMGLGRRVGEGSFSMHSAVQACLANLFESELQAERAWLERSYCQVCGRAGNQLFKILQANPSFGQSLLSLEERNLHFAYQMALRNRDFDSLREILCGLRAALILQGRWSEWETIVAQLEALLTGPEGQPNMVDELLWFRLLGHRAEICEHRRNFDHLHRLHQQLRQQHPQEGLWQGHILDDLGAMARARGLPEEASRFYLKSLAWREQKADVPGQAQVMMRLGDLSLSQRKYREAEKWFLKTLEIWTRLGQSAQQAFLYSRLGITHQERGDLDQAESWYRQSLALRETLQDQPGQAQSIHQLGNVALLQGRLEAAEPQYGRSLQLCEELGDLPGQVRNLHQLGQIARARGQSTEADALEQRAALLLDAQKRDSTA